MNIKQKGFSLFELLVVISIIGILTAVITVSFSSAQKRGKDASRIQTLNNIQKAAEQYYSARGSYPDTWTQNVQWRYPDVAGGQVYLEKFPATWPVGVLETDIYKATGSSSSYCVCGKLNVSGSGNYKDNTCTSMDGTDPVNPLNYYCVKNLQ